jgi:hypothetical protein
MYLQAANTTKQTGILLKLCVYHQDNVSKPVDAFLLLTADQGDHGHGRLAGAPLQKETQHPPLESFYHRS